MLVLLLVSALTGSILAFQHELDAWLNPGLLRVPHTQPALSADTLIDAVERGDPRLRVSQLPLDARPGESVELRVVPRTDPLTGHAYRLGFDRLFVDPATARVLGHRTWGAFRLDRVHALTFIDQLHRRFHLPGRWGMWLTGGLALTWLASALIGAWLTLPNRTAGLQDFRARWRPAWRIKRGASPARITFDLHRSAGLWSLPLAAVLALSGLYFSLGDEIVRPLLRLAVPVSTHPLRTLPVAGAPDEGAGFGSEEAVRRARAYLPPVAHDFLPWYVSHLPAQHVYRVAFKEDGLRERAGKLRYEQIFIDHRSGALRATSGYDSGTTGDRILVWQYPLHTGRILGLPGKLLVCAGGLITASIAATGLLIWRQRARARAVAAKRATPGNTVRA